MNETLFRATATAVMKEANRRHGKEDVLGRKLLSTLDIDVIVSEAIKVAGKNRITDCPGPLGGFWEAVDYMGDVVFDQQPNFPVRAKHVIEAMWGMPNWLCVIEQGCWDCLATGELGNRNSTYLWKEDRETCTVRIDGLYAVAYKNNNAEGWSDKSEEHAKSLALKDLVSKAGS